MGLGMALNLARHLKTVGAPALRYSNRTLEKGKPLEAAGALPEQDYASVVKGSDIIFTMVGFQFSYRCALLILPRSRMTKF